MKEGTCYVVGAGEFAGNRIRPEPGDLVIAADGGLLHLERLGVVPDLVLGDFDSFPYREGLPNAVRHPPQKDDTDTHLAVKEGWERGFRTFALYGGTGGRADHSFANLQTLCMLSKRGAIGYLVGKRQVATIITDGSFRVPAPGEAPAQHRWLPRQSGYLSVFAFSDVAKGVCLSGLKYPLSQATLTNAEPLGVSNEFTGAEASVTVKEGSLLLIWEA